jgi:hypothetical protein
MMHDRKYLTILIVACIALSGLLSACGGGTTTITRTIPATRTTGTTAGPDLSGCPGATGDYQVAREMITEYTERYGAGSREVALAEKHMHLIVTNCKLDHKTAEQEHKMCVNTPQELAEAFRTEETKANEEYIGVYEVVCGRHVALP